MTKPPERDALLSAATPADQPATTPTLAAQPSEVTPQVKPVKAKKAKAPAKAAKPRRTTAEVPPTESLAEPGETPGSLSPDPLSAAAQPQKPNTKAEAKAKPKKAKAKAAPQPTQEAEETGSGRPTPQPALSEAEQQTFDLRMERYRSDLEGSLRQVYGDQIDAIWPRLEALLKRSFGERPAELRRLDEARLLPPDWLQAPEMIGYVAYADRFAGTLRGVGEHLDYLEELGIKYLHLMPLLKPRAGENDGGYAVQDYKAVRGDLGSMADLRSLAGELRARGISLELDLVINHVAEEHDWAVKARAGYGNYRDYFLMFPNREQPDLYERSLPEVFPDFAPGNFTWNEAARSWVWTTFNSYQWDLNWANPNIFLEFVDIILYLANQGVEIFRLDALAFIWKRMGTDSQNQPEVHDLTRALRAAAWIVAPAVAFKAEAIVAPGDLTAYLGQRDHHGKVSDMAYHNSLMVQLWSSLASRNTRLFEQALLAFAPKPTNTTWGLYVRCHDDIGWAISDHDAGLSGTVGWGHRAFLSDFYSGEAPGSFARGQVFQANPRTGDKRVSGSAASLAGLEAAETGAEVESALRRLRLLHAVTIGYGGVPLLYMGDELALMNDYSYADTPEHAPDNRWMHRPQMDWDKAEERRDPQTSAGKMYAALQNLIQARQHLPHLHASTESQVMRSPNEHTLLLRRTHPQGNMLAVYNFTDEFQALPAWALREVVGAYPRDAISGHEWNLTNEEVALEPYGAYWLIEQVH